MTGKEMFFEETVLSDLGISEEIERLLPRYVEILSKLIQFKSFRYHEDEIQEFMKQHMENLGLDPQVFCCREDEASKNIVAVLQGTQPNIYKSLVLNAHCDIAPVDDPERWSMPPFSGQVINGKIYGRGAQDDKAGLALLLMICEALKNLKIKLKGDLIFQSVLEDETSGSGTKVLIDHGFNGDGAIICDGTWPERIIYAHLGQIWLNIKVLGEPVAACVEHRGVNPIYLAMEFIATLKRYIDTLKPIEPFEKLKDAVFVNVGSFHSGVWHGSVPSQALLQIQVGFPAAHKPEEFLQSAKFIAQGISPRIDVQVDSLITPAFRTEPDNILIKKLRSVVQKNASCEVLTIPVTGHGDLRHFKSSTVCLYGPGGGKNAHGIDEYYLLDHLPRVAKNILQFILDWCNENKEDSNRLDERSQSAFGTCDS